MSLGSFFSRLFGRKPKAPPAGKRPAAAPPTAAPKAPPAGPPKPDPQPAPAKELSQDLLQGSAGAPGATMVFQTVPIATASLVVKSDGEEGSSHRLGEGRITVGRAPDSGVQIDHPSVGLAPRSDTRRPGPLHALRHGQRRGHIGQRQPHRRSVHGRRRSNIHGLQ